MKFGIALLALALPALADEGMWLFNQFPKAQVKQKYNFEATDAFLQQLRLSTARVDRGSGSFVSPKGLIFTNHHVAAGCIAKVSTAERNYEKNGFTAASPADEPRCPDIEVLVLVKLDNVTARVKAAARPEATAAETVAARHAAIAVIENECVQKTGDRCDVVTLFPGERYDLYQFKRYTDVRLVFAPEYASAFFGGDIDNFTYPRYNLDIAFLRAYENGKPAATPNYLKWSPQGARDGELVFLAGNPGSTSRLQTVAQLNFLRDHNYPAYLARLRTRIEWLTAFAALNEENKRISTRLLHSLSNSYKGTAGKAAGLRDSKLMLRKRAFEQRIRNAVERDPKLGVEALKVWDEVAAAYKLWTPFEKQYQALEKYAAQGSTLFKIARDMIRLAEENAKPDPQRLAEYRDASRRTLELTLYSPAPIHDAMEAGLLQLYFEELRAALGEKDPILKAVLAGRTAEQASQQCVAGTKLKDPAARRNLAALADDPMIKLARLLDEPARKVRKKREEIIEAVDVSSAARIAQYRYKMFGANEYPDATFTPRVTFGAIKGYKDKTETAVPWATTFGGLYHRATGEDPYILPPRWIEGAKKLNLVTPMNFVSTVDITGGNSGSPTVNAKGEVIGIVFDSNLEGLPNVFQFTDEQARAVHVAGQGIVESLKKLYGASALLEELGLAGKAPASN